MGVAYKAKTLQPAGVFDDEPGESAAAVWMRGGGFPPTAPATFMERRRMGLLQPAELRPIGIQTEAVGQRTATGGLVHALQRDCISMITIWIMSEPVLVLPQQSGPYPNLLAASGRKARSTFWTRRIWAISAPPAPGGHADCARVAGIRSRGWGSGLLE